jgi:hypothetical protein
MRRDSSVRYLSGRRLGQHTLRGVNILKPWVKVLLVTVLIAAPAMVLGPVIWPPAEGGPGPTGGQLPFFIFLALMESVLLGLGISFLLFGLPAVRRVSPDSRLRAWAMYVTIGWLMVSWWPHDNRHINNGENMQGSCTSSTASTSR